MITFFKKIYIAARRSTFMLVHVHVSTPNFQFCFQRSVSVCDWLLFVIILVTPGERITFCYVPIVITSRSVSSFLPYHLILLNNKKAPRFRMRRCHDWNLIIEAVVQRFFVEKAFLEISQNSHENTCARASFSIKLQT